MRRGQAAGTDFAAFRPRRIGVIFVAVLAAAALSVQPSAAAMKYFQIARLLNFKTECQMRAFEDRSAPTGPGRYFITCDNVTFYPDGLLLECPDRDDEWTCRMLTQPRKFEGLDLLRQRPQ